MNPHCLGILDMVCNTCVYQFYVIARRGYDCTTILQGALLTMSFHIVSNMMNKLSGQPNTYDKKFVEPRVSLPLCMPAHDSLQSTVSIRPNPRRRNVRNRARS